MTRVVKPAGKAVYNVRFAREGLDRPVLRQAKKVINLAVKPPPIKKGRK